MATDDALTDKVKNYYNSLKSQNDLQTKACISDDKTVPKHIRKIFLMIHDEVNSRYYGCGLVIPAKLEGMKVLDLGSGSGRDCFVVSKMVGQEGYVTGVDMTEGQLEVARKHIPYHTEKFGYSKPNVEFVQGYIEKLTAAGVPENSQDIIISNCVVNLSPDKKAVLSEAYKVLKVGGELYFSDTYCDRVLPASAREHEVLWGECFSGCLCWNELYSLAAEIGFSPPRMVSTAPIDVEREDFKKVLGDAKFISTTYHLFKLPETKESPKQVIYKGKISENEDEFLFDHQFTFKTGEPVEVDSELATILTASRFKEEFDFKPSSKEQGGCCKISVQVDPFAYIAEKAKKGEKVAPACCGGNKECR